MTYDIENKVWGNDRCDKLKSLRKCGGHVAPNVPGMLSHVAPGLQTPSAWSPSTLCFNILLALVQSIFEDLDAFGADQALRPKVPNPRPDL